MAWISVVEKWIRLRLRLRGAGYGLRLSSVFEKWIRFESAVGCGCGVLSGLRKVGSRWARESGCPTESQLPPGGAKLPNLPNLPNLYF